MPMLLAVPAIMLIAASTLAAFRSGSRRCRRLDHTIANLQSLAYAESHGVHAVLTDGRNEARVISGHIRIPKKPGFYLSVFAYGGECRGVSEIGVRYPLRDAVLSVNFPLGVSNEIVDDYAEIEVREGRLLVILSGKEREEAEA